LILVGILLIPAIAAAVPGSGPFVSGETPSGRNVTQLYNTLAKICVVILIIVEGFLFYAIFRFRRQSDDEQPEPNHGDFTLEVGWTLAALFIQIFIGWRSVDVMWDTEPHPESQKKAEMVVEAHANQWDWSFRYPEQGVTSQHLVIPANTWVELDVTSDDVLHSLFVPELGIKVDAVPGRWNYWVFKAAGPDSQQTPPPGTWNPGRDDGANGTSWLSYFQPETPGPDREELQFEATTGLRNSKEPGPSQFASYDAVEYRGMCTELCGVGHWRMYFKTVSMTQPSFEEWVADRKAASTSAEADGAQVYSNNCAQCHQPDGAGQGSNFPPLVDTKWTNEQNEESKRNHIEVVLMGSKASTLNGPTTIKGTTYNMQMQSHSQLNDAEVAAVVNHERTSWGNNGGEVDADMVAEMREQLGLQPRPVVAAGQVAATELRDLGKELYSTCTACHGTDGQGPDTVPNLKGNPTVLGPPKKLVEILDYGQDTDRWPGRQTPAGQDLSDKKLAALLSYIRYAWGNEGAAVQPTEIKRIRSNLRSNKPLP
jgi:heme/copper-type cytochrome/quinol oxidase subunit 2